MGLIKMPFGGKGKTVELKCTKPVELNVSKYLKQREMSRLNRPVTTRKQLSTYVAGKSPYVLRQNQFDLSGYDKVFAGAWLNDTDVVLGTKCNKLLVMNTTTSRSIEIPSVQTSEQQIHDARSNSSLACAGIHSIAINPSKTLLAVGTGKPLEVVVYGLPTFEPVAVFTGHTDLVFTLSWVTDTLLVSGSRDTRLNVWELNQHVKTPIPTFTKDVPCFGPTMSRAEHKGKVRDLKVDAPGNRMVTLSSDGTVKLWDVARVDVISTTHLFFSNETVCIDHSPNFNLYAVGSQSHVSLLDTRSTQISHTFESLDEGWGVRSVAFNDHIITTGGGLGRLGFYDLRMGRYLNLGGCGKMGNTTRMEVKEKKDDQAGKTVRYYETGSGWLNKDSVYLDHFQGINIKNAIYALTYSPDRTKLLTAGGPLQLGLCGSYAAIW